jgi:ABC-type lipoprotein export system ATPase subunit
MPPKGDGGIRAADLRFAIGDRVLLDGLSLDVPSGGSFAVVGPSGSGKTTLLNAVAGILDPEATTLEVAGLDLLGARWATRADHRLRRIGMVFQQPELLPELTAGENVSLPLRLMGRAKAESGAVARDWLERVGLADAADRRPDTLSGGEAQRVAVARALAHEPAVVLADEPTGSLDEGNAQAIAEMLFDLGREQSAAVLMVTHDLTVARRADEVRSLRGGRLVRRPPAAGPSA